MALSDYLVTDDLTILLGLITASVFLLYNLYKPQSLVHPILLGRQSDVGRVRNPGESAVHRNYGTGLMGRFPLRPTREVQTLLDLVKPEYDAPRTLWSTKITNPQLRERAAAFGTGLLRAGLTRDSNVLLLLNDSIEFLITDIALASHSIPSFTLSSPSLLSPVLDNHPPTAIVIDAGFLPNVLELIYDTNELSHHVVIVVGEPDSKALEQAAEQIKLVRWSDIEEEGKRGEKLTSPTPDPNDVFTVSFYEDHNGQLQGAQLSHQNLTAGVTTLRGLLPLSNPLTALDTIVSAYPLSTSFGRAIAYTALYEGTSFATTHSTRLYRTDDAIVPPGLPDLFSTKSLPLPSPTILFAKPEHLNALTASIISEAEKSLAFSFAWRHKMAGVLDGYITNQSLWDRLVFDGARTKVLGASAGTIRGIVVSGGTLDDHALTPTRIALSIPFVHAHTHPLVTAPVFASHPLDLQTFDAPKGAKRTPDAALAHVGPPTINIEVKLVGVDDDALEKGADPVGHVHVRGPIVGRLLAVSEDAEDSVDAAGEEPWAPIGHNARVQTNGSFKVWPVEK
ncbi:acetyl-CoA synthetase-like protein [Dentipellis sp. KUC8613]|nr:acetyl-CoA synthetase-like protein [Dentipellis sp. KUC8613]